MYDTLPDRQGLLAPVKPDSPAGSDLRCTDIHGTDIHGTDLNSTDLFLLTRDIRSAARDNERLRAQGNTCDNTRLRAQWQQVADQCCTLITSHSKDLDVCAWLIEAWSRLNGLRGIIDGCTLYRDLLTQFWDCLFPAPESADDMATRVSALNALNGGSRTGTLVEAINHFAITCNSTNNEDGDDDQTRFALWQYRAAIDAQRISDDHKRQQRFATLGFSLQQIQQAADDTAITLYQALLADCDMAQHALQQLDDALTNRLGPHSPSTTLINNALDDMRDALNHLASKRLASEIAVVVQDTRSTTAPTNPITDTDSTLQSIPLQRYEAIAQLKNLARYFRTMEPHSPLACAIDRLVRWANMPYDELMRELIPDHSARDVLWLMAGIAPDSQRS